MSFDLSRISFDARKDFLGVIMQQGRVQLDADWNEWVAQFARRIQAGTLDTLGRAVVPRETADGFLITANAGVLSIGRGRIYVDGLLAENHGDAPLEWDAALAEQYGEGTIPFLDQPYLPFNAQDANAQSAASRFNRPDFGDGKMLLYLDVWRREVSYLQDPELVEKAVGVDTTGRLQTVWQVKILPNAGDIACTSKDDEITGWQDIIRPSAGRLSTDTGKLDEEENPCHVSPAAGYLGVENQLYRIEIHTPGTPGNASFKWSRDRVESLVTGINPAGNKLTVESMGRDEVLRFNNGDWVEITDDWHELHNRPGELRRIKIENGVDDITRTIQLESALSSGLFPTDGQGKTISSRHTRIRRWDQSGTVYKENGDEYSVLDTSGEIIIPADGSKLFLEKGILVDFSLASEPSLTGGEFKSGDYWLVAARSVDGSIDELDEAPPLGIHHHYARLAVFDPGDGEPDDCRTLWPPVIEGEGCDCTVCVDAALHNSGVATIQQAIDAVKETGGTICLGAGSYEIDKPIAINKAKSIRVRGQGWKTLLLRKSSGNVISIRGGSGVSLENLTVVGSSLDEKMTPMIQASNILDFNLLHANILGIAGAGSTSIAVGLSGFILGGRISRCALAAEGGISNVFDKRDKYMLSAQLDISDSVFWCSERGISFSGMSLHYGALNVRDNLILGTTHSGILARGGAFPGASVDISGNQIYTPGTGINAGCDGLRIQGNEIHGDMKAKSKLSDGISLIAGLDPGNIDNAQIIGNRIHNVRGNGIAIRHRVENAMIKQNVIDGTRLSGLYMEGDGSAGYLSIENNQFRNLGKGFNPRGTPFAGMQLVAVDRVDVVNNVFEKVGRDAAVSLLVAGIAGVYVKEARVAGNRLHGIGPVSSPLTVAGIYFRPPFLHLAIDDNSVSRAADDKETLETATSWLAVFVGSTAIGGTAITDATSIRAAAADNALGTEFNEALGLTHFAGISTFTVDNTHYAISDTRIFVLAPTSLAVSTRGNRLRGEQARGPIVAIAGGESCLFAENHCQMAGNKRNVLGDIAILSGNSVNASNNRLMSVSDGNSLSIKSSESGAVVLGNIVSGKIILNGSSLPAPWAPLNILAH